MEYGHLVAGAVVISFAIFIVKKVKDSRDNKENNTGGGRPTDPSPDVDEIEK